jgi:hypothetical protein
MSLNPSPKLQQITKSSNRKPVELVWNRKNSVSAMVGKKVVGMASAWRDSNDNFVILNVEVRDQYRRRGIATSMYQAIEAAAEPLRPAVSLSDDGFEFWKSYRPAAVAKDLRHWKDLLIGARVMKEGHAGRITKASGGTATMAYDVPLPNGSISTLRAKDINAALAAAGGPTIDFDAVTGPAEIVEIADQDVEMERESPCP